MATQPPRRPARSKTPIRVHTVPPPAAQEGPRVLRIGVLLGDKIVEERLIRERVPVTIGQSARNTFSVPSSELPRTWTLFPYAGGKYMLQFADTMDGRISDGGQVFTLTQLKQSGKARHEGPVWVIGLPETARGKIVMGDATFLFQFVQAPAIAPRPSLPASVRGRFLDRIDPYLGVILAFSLVIHGSVWGYCRYVLKDPPPLPPDQIPDQFASVTIKQPPAAPPTPEKGELPKEEEKKDAAKEKSDDKPKEKPRPQTGDDGSKASVEQKVASAAPIRVLKTLGAKGNAGGIATSDKEGWEDLGNGLAHVGNGEVVATVGTSGQSTRGTGTETEVATGTGAGKVKGPAGPAQTGVAKVEHEVKGGGNAGKIEDIESGGLDPDKVATTIKNRYQSRVIACYQRALKTNQGLGGKVVVSFTVGPAGSVIKASAEGFDDGVDRCIEQEARTWRFEKPEGQATFEIPFVLRKLN